MKLVALGLIVASATAVAGTCPKTPRLAFDPPGDRHSLPQLTWDGTRYTLIGYDGPPTSLQRTTFDFGKGSPVTKTVSTGGVAQTATNPARQVAIIYLDKGAIVRKAPAMEKTDPDADFLTIDGRRVHAPLKDRSQSFFQVLDASGKQVVKPFPLGDQRVSHVAPGVQVAWNPIANEWGVVWSEFNHLTFARIGKTGKLSDQRRIVVDGFVHSSSRMVWTGKAYAFLVREGTTLWLYEIEAGSIQRTTVTTGETLEPVLAFDGTTFGIAYRVRLGSKPKRATPPAPAGAKPAPSPPQNRVPLVEGHELRFVTVTDRKAGAPIAIAHFEDGPSIDTPVIAADGAQWVVVWGELHVAAPAWDDRLMVTRLDAKGAHAKGYPARLDPEEVHQGYASIAGTGCDLAISYALGDPNANVRIAAIRAP